MTKQLLFLVLALVSFSLHAQLVLTEASPGIVNVEYSDTAGTWDPHDPQGASELYVYMWINQDQAAPALAEAYTDDWNNSASLVLLTWAVDKFVGVIDFNTHDFANTGGVLPVNTVLSDFNFLLRSQAGPPQSTDLLATTYGFMGTVLNNYDYKAESASFYANGALHLNALTVNEQVEVQIVDSLGRQIFSSQFVVTQEEMILDVSSLHAKVAIVRVRTSADKYFVKKIVL